MDIEKNEVVGSGEGVPVKSEKQLKKEAMKKEKNEQYQKKLERLESKPVMEKKPKEKKELEIIAYDEDTPKGCKKVISNAMPESYSPRYVEAAWYSWWEKEGFFKPEYGRDLSEENPEGKFVIVLPPPNVTGSLHLGHALTSAIEDSITRWHRMNGRTTLWNPGCDHAGIATQVVVEKKLIREQQKSRHDLGREKFMAEVWKWKEEKGDTIYEQLRMIGSSVDWDRAVFTMDEKMSRCVTESFVKLHEMGLIYRSNRLVNWSCSLRSAISDIEVDTLELNGRTFLTVPGHEDKVEFGVLISFAYCIEDSDEQVVVATTRIETMLGDSAIAVHPEDKRYIHLHGRYAVHPFLNRRLPIVCDDFVQMEFGTGAVKITPAHDHNDFDVGKRHQLEFVNIMNDDGILNENCGSFFGMKRFEARRVILDALKEKGLYRETKDNPMSIPLCSRSNDIVEPLLKIQWYVDCKEMAYKTAQVVRNGELKLIPDSHNSTWYHWLDNIRDWCISRQLWWGHRIPAYYAKCSDASIDLGSDNDRWITGRTYEEALKKASDKFKLAPESLILDQDEDVLDTWFSSALFPFGIFGWPEKTNDLKEFYPGHLLETGHDILFFWVARMVMMGITLLGELPFKEVYLHSIVRDAHGRKMSKSLGNVIDPKDVIHGISLENLHALLYNSNLDPSELERAIEGQKEDFPEGIPECGTDALRFALCSYTVQGRDINLDINRVVGYRYFCNKIWNATKLSLMIIGENYREADSFMFSSQPIDDWILNRLSYAADECNEAFKTYDFPKATTACHNFFLYEFCDIYLEAIKPLLKSGESAALESSRHTLFTCLSNALRLLSPFMPYITEELYQRLPHTESITSICVAPYPKNLSWRNESVEKDFELVNETIRKVRSLRSEYGLTREKMDLFLTSESESTRNKLNNYFDAIQALTYSKSINIGLTASSGCAIVPISTNEHFFEAHLLLKGAIDLTKEIEKHRQRELRLNAQLESLNVAINAQHYDKIPEKIKQQNLEKIQNTQRELSKIVEAISSLQLLDSQN